MPRKKARVVESDSESDSDSDSVVFIDAPEPKPPPADLNVIVGIDIGTRNLGVGMIQRDTPMHKKGLFFNVDMYIGRDKDGKWREIEFEQSTVFQIVNGLFDDFDDLLLKARCIGVELQPFSTGRTKGKKKFKGKSDGSAANGIKMKLISAVIVATATARYPQARVMFMNTKFTRGKLQQMYKKRMLGNVDYDGSKAASMALGKHLLSADKFKTMMDRFAQTFTAPDGKKKKEQKCDPLEAFLIALVLESHEAEAWAKFKRPPKLDPKSNPQQTKRITSWSFEFVKL